MSQTLKGGDVDVEITIAEKFNTFFAGECDGQPIK